MTDSSKLKVKNSKLTTQSLTGSKGGASTMAELMAKHQKAFVSLKKGESVKGKIVKLSSSEILVDAGAKTHALVLEKDKRILNVILSTFKVGDEIEVNVLNPESETGQPIVSLRRYLGQKAWTKLEELQKSKEQIDVRVSEAAKAGYVLDTDFGISGFLPHSHASQQGLGAGQTLKVTVLEVNRKDNKIIFSQKPVLSEEDFEAAIKKFKVGDKVKGTISNVAPFGLFVSLEGGIEGFVHISEVSWEKVDDLAELFKAGDPLETIITKFDKDGFKIGLSLKRLTADPFEELMAAFPVDKKVVGTVTKIEDAGVTLIFEGHSTLRNEPSGSDSKRSEYIEGFIKKEKIPVGTTYHEGQTVNATVSEHDKRRHRIILVPVLLEKPIGYR
jgi:small subunit ribosomal protein S1